MDIWYSASTVVHPFLEKSFIDKVTSDMRNLYIPGSDTWVYVEDNSIIGFVSMIDNEIGGLFILPDDQSKGVGRKLVDFIAETHKNIEVEVFEKNDVARKFYQKYGFKQIKQYFHEESKNEVLRLSIDILFVTNPIFF